MLSNAVKLPIRALFYSLCSIVMLYLCSLSITPVYAETPVIVPGNITLETDVQFDSTIDYVNDYRLQHGLPILKSDGILQKTVQERAESMVASSNFSHYDDAGMNFYQYMIGQGTAPSVACENLSLSFSNASNVPFSGWKNSNAHNACMLDERMNSYGYQMVQFDIQSNRPRYVAILILGS